MEPPGTSSTSSSAPASPARKKVSVIVPTLNAAPHLPGLLAALAGQRRRPDEILIVDSSSEDATVAVARDAGCRVHVIDRREFNHGATRNLAASLATGAILVYMTQDVVPVDESFIETLIAPIAEGRAVAACARQMTAEGAQPTERLIRRFNYPETGSSRSVQDVPRLGYKAYFISNAAAAYDRVALEAVGGFDGDVIMCEDVLVCAKLLAAGGRAAYVAEARVYHTHSYTLGQQFRRYFDIGVFMRDCRDRLAGAGTSSEGLRMVRWMVGRLLAEGRPLWAFYCLIETAVKFLAMRLGKAYRRLPRSWVRKFSMHKGFWR